MKKPLVSIVLPIYNSSAYLKFALKSIFEQSYTNLEVIITDDSNTDEALVKYVSDFKVYKNLSYYKNPGRKGIFCNLNYAISLAKGDYIQIFCQDDIMENDFIDSQLILFKKYPDCGMVFSNFKRINENGEQSINNLREGYRKKWPEFISGREFKAYSFLYNSLPGNISPVMLPRKTIFEIGKFNEKLQYASDIEFWYLIACKFNIVYNKKDALLLRVHNNQASQTLGVLLMIKEVSHFYKVLFEDLVENGYDSDILIKYINYNRGVFLFYVYLRKYFINHPKSIFLISKYLNRNPFKFSQILGYSIITLFGKINIFPKMSINSALGYKILNNS